MREEIITEFCKSDTKLRIIIASTAFGLGIDCKDIACVINYGTPNTLEELVQEMGRAGRNGDQSNAILYHKAIGKISKQAKLYGENKSVCRRELLFKDAFLRMRIVLLDVSVVIYVLYYVLVKIANN